MEKPTEDKLNSLVDLIKTSATAYYCKFCGRYLPLKDGVFIHDKVHHPENYVYEGGTHIQ